MENKEKTPPPDLLGKSQKAKASIWRRDLRELPGLRMLFRPFRALINRLSIFLLSRRSRAKVLLFSELSRMLAMRTPLPQALELCEESFTSLRPAGSWLPYLIAQTLGWPLELRNAIAAEMTARLRRFVEKGMSLSEAMDAFYPFDSQEVAIVRAGEEWSLLPEALRRLARFQAVDCDMSEFWRKALMYPFALFIMAVSIISFIYLYVMPKIADMYVWATNGSPLPPFSRTLYSMSPHQGTIIFALLLFGVIAAVIFLFVASRLQLRMDWIPILGRGTRADRQARWLAALSLGLDAHVPPAQAVRRAGEMSGGRMRRRSQEAARMIEQGHSIGKACLESKLLPARLSRQLALAEGAPNFMEALRDIAQDAEQDARHTMARFCSAFEIVCHLCIALVIACAVIALYLPIFEIGSYMCQLTGI
ncbi:MAG: type II secretion system F family protein [Candidatus Sumerlaeota bacterium]|nr:type II secretion system F family protein [Candidatus Sumerlaeota bacterium]